MISTLITGTVLSVTVEGLDQPLPRTHVLLQADDGPVEVVLPGSNGPPVVVGGVPLLTQGETWQVRVQHTAEGLVPVGLGAGMARLDAMPPPPWALNGVTYDDSQLPLDFLMNEEGAADLGADLTEQIIEKALSDWTGVGCSDWAFTYGGRTTAGFDDDGINVLSWENDSWTWGAEVAGLTSTRFDTSGKDVVPVGADIVFNGVDWTWDAETGDVYLLSPTLHAGSVVLHELGHVAGLDHELSLVTSTMFFAYIGGSWQGSLAGDDRRGLCEKYGDGADECATDADCKGIDDQPRTCVDIDGVKVCDEVRDSVGDFCSRTVFNCEQYCIFTDNQALEGYCSIGCEGDGDCPPDYECGTASLFLYDDPGVDEKLCIALPPPSDSGIGDTGSTGDGGGGDGGGADTGAPAEEGGCGCAAAPAGRGWLVLLAPLLALFRRR